MIELTKEELIVALVALTEKINSLLALHQKITAELAAMNAPPPEPTTA
jgi:hypothetical protein